ncbi:MAG: amidohydrolase family protein [Candidatus Heteroscillospira sp.]|jgi:predicted TIM-barrel fold metal-dependent hydrolase
MLIDFHTHVFPEALAPRAIAKLSKSAGLFPHTDGTADSLRQLMEHDGVSLSVILPIATNPASQRHVNDYAISCAGRGLLPFGTIHPDAPDALEELERLHGLGIKGIKFHPEYQSFYPDEEKMRPIYRKISELGLITVFHAGPDYGYRPPYHATPEHMLGALKYLDAPVVAAHWGGVNSAEEVLKTLRGIPQLYLDTAFGYGTAIRPFAHDMIEAFGSDHILFGSDAPWHPPAWETCLLNSLDLPADVMEAVCSGNARRLLGLS